MAEHELRSLRPEEVLGKIDLSAPGLTEARLRASRGEEEAAFAALLDYYRRKFPLSPVKEVQEEAIEQADKICNHVFQWGPYAESDYGPEVNWEADPAGDIEWVAAIYRFFWARQLAEAYRQTRDNKYAKAFVDLTTDWITKHPLEDRDRVHPVYGHWRGFPWLDIQTGIRATSICAAFKVLVHSEAFTPEFLRLLLASLYDHQMKTKLLPRGTVHNKAIFEQRGFVNVAYHFSEFKESRAWMELAMERARENFLAQTTSDGVQREWSYGYHEGVLHDAIEIKQRMDEMQIPVPADFQERIRLMYDYIFAVATPDLGAPMFGDGKRPLLTTTDRSQWQLYNVLTEGTKLLKDPKYEARAKLNREHLPQQKSYAFKEAGMYVLRNDWGPDQIHLGLHCSPKGLSIHDQEDNGTFELYAYGRWLMPDTGFYTYGHDAAARAWHRQTKVHQTLTLDGKNTEIAGRHLLWLSEPGCEAVVVENESYRGDAGDGSEENLIHRRTVWFVDKQFFVFYDEAIGDLPGQLELHFQFAPGAVAVEKDQLRAHTLFDNANVLVSAAQEAPLSIEEEDGWFAWSYGKRKQRRAISFRHRQSAPAAFLTVVAPYRGTVIPEVQASIIGKSPAGADRVEAEVTAFGRRYLVGRDLASGDAWCNG